ncbi:MAG TPA: hypothetical protein VLE27_01835 [Thermoanaerobaculia bacterium]|nr:hypothetical protein [Thermoanaerobaculia bacterium]
MTFAGCSRGEEAPEGQDDVGAPVAPASNNPAGALPLPEFTPCASTTQPTLPAKWQATALMQDFFLNTLTFGNFVYDESANAFRFAIADQYGMDFDFLTTTDGKLYLLEGDGDMPTSCTLLTNSSPYTVPGRAWLGESAVCVGQAPILEREQQWWKNPSGDVGANWFWYNTSNNLPFRSMYYADAPVTTPVPIYEHFTFNYFPSFEGVASTNLGQILQMCQSTARTPTATAEYSKPSIEPLLKKSKYPQKDARLASQIQSWIPGVTDCSSTGSLPPQWPDQLQITAFMTAVNFNFNPFPTRIYYDWTAKSQNTTLYYNPPTQQNFAQVALLLNNSGYITNVEEGGATSSCSQVLPGPPVPDWKQVDGCECRAEIAPGTVLNPSTVPTKILWCPTDLELKQVFWTWYSDTGTPVVFMQSNSSPSAGTGLNLADYYQWGPGSVAPAGTFDLPQACQGQPIVPDAFPKACNNCHLPLNARGAAAKAAAARTAQ